MRELKLKRTQHSDKPLHESRTVVNYADLIGSGSELDVKPRKTKKLKPVPSEPSSRRIAAQGTKSEKPINKHPIPLLPCNRQFHRKDPAGSKPLRRNLKTKPNSDNNDGSTNIDHDPPTKDQTDDPPTSSLTTSKGVFKTTEHGIKIHKAERYFLCPVCNIHKASTQRLNEHFKRRHAAFKCEKCEKSFNTPSGLARHRYTHEQTQHFCNQCGKGYYFVGELNQHSLTHCTICTHVCNYANCNKSYLNKSDLLKHVCCHTSKMMKCKKCDYSTRNKKLLISHQQVHEDNLRYYCDKCGKMFKHRNQARRHKLNPNLCITLLKHSDSLEF